MSIGPPALSNILVQRLDAVLGTSMAAYANLVNGARPNAVAPPGETDKNALLDENGQPVADTAGDSAQQIANAKTAADLSLAARGLVTSTDLTASAPTTLGATARTILALLAQVPGKAQPSQGKAPLWGTTEDEDASPASNASGQTAPQTVNASGQQSVNSAGQQAEQQSGNAQQQQTPRASAARTSTPLTAGQTATAQAAAADGPQPAQLIQALRAALQQTGMFYESHLTQLAFGQRTVQELADEPQAQLNQNDVITRDTPGQANTPEQANTPSMPASAQSTASWSSGAGLSASRGTTGSLLNTSSNSSSTTLTLSNSFAGDNSNPLAGIHPEATTLVRQQLDVLANQSIVWQGQAWPGTDMRWEVARDRTQGGELMDESHWATRLEIQLPRIGLVQARLNLSGNQVVMNLVAPSSANELSQNGDSLRQRFSSAGLALSQLTVDTQPPSPFEMS